MSGKFSLGSRLRTVLKEKCSCSRWARGEGLSELGAQGKGSESGVVLVVSGGGGSRHQEAAEAGRPPRGKVGYENMAFQGG